MIRYGSQREREGKCDSKTWNLDGYKDNGAIHGRMETKNKMVGRVMISFITDAQNL